MNSSHGQELLASTWSLFHWGSYDVWTGSYHMMMPC